MYLNTKQNFKDSQALIVLDYGNFKPAETILLLKMIRYSAGNLYRYGITFLAKKTGLSKSTVSKYVSQFLEKGILRQHSEPGRKAHTYELPVFSLSESNELIYSFEPSTSFIQRSLVAEKSDLENPEISESYKDRSIFSHGMKKKSLKLKDSSSSKPGAIFEQTDQKENKGTQESVEQLGGLEETNYSDQDKKEIIQTWEKTFGQKLHFKVFTHLHIKIADFMLFLKESSPSYNIKTTPLAAFWYYLNKTPNLGGQTFPVWSKRKEKRKENSKCLIKLKGKVLELDINNGVINRSETPKLNQNKSTNIDRDNDLDLVKFDAQLLKQAEDSLLKSNSFFRSLKLKKDSPIYKAALIAELEKLTKYQSDKTKKVCNG